MFILPIHFCTYLGRNSKKVYIYFIIVLIHLMYLRTRTMNYVCLYICVCVLCMFVKLSIRITTCLLLAAVVYHKLFNLRFVMSRDFSFPLITSFSFLGIVT